MPDFCASISVKGLHFNEPQLNVVYHYAFSYLLQYVTAFCQDDYYKGGFARSLRLCLVYCTVFITTRFVFVWYVF